MGEPRRFYPTKNRLGSSRPVALVRPKLVQQKPYSVKEALDCAATGISPSTRSESKSTCSSLRNTALISDRMKLG
jgi:hypothetical protein